MSEPDLIESPPVSSKHSGLNRIDRMVIAAAPAIVQGVIASAQAGNKTALELFFKYGLTPAREAKRSAPPHVSNSMNVAISLVSPESAPKCAEDLELHKAMVLANKRAGMAKTRAIQAEIRARRAAAVPSQKQLGAAKAGKDTQKPVIPSTSTP